jgi:hypothetical protein
MKRKLNIGILTQSALFKKTLKEMLENLNKLNASDFLTIKEIETDLKKLDILIVDDELKYVNEFSNANGSYKLNEGLNHVIITKKKMTNLPDKDVCLVKPFRFLEMANIFYKFYSEFSISNNYEVKRGRLKFYFTDKLLSYDGKKSVYLTDKESDIMMALMNNKYEGINKEQILYEVWGFSKNMSTHTFETHLYRLRKKIKDNLISGELIINKNSNYFLNPHLLENNL